MSNLKNKSELLFLYNVKDANPNGDPWTRINPALTRRPDTTL